MNETVETCGKAYCEHYPEGLFVCAKCREESTLAHDKACAKIAEARAEIEEGARLELYGRIQTLWAEELPTLPLTEESRRAVSLPTIGSVRVNGLGMMHYEYLTKEVEQ